MSPSHPPYRFDSHLPDSPSSVRQSPVQKLGNGGSRDRLKSIWPSLGEREGKRHSMARVNGNHLSALGRPIIVTRDCGWYLERPVETYAR